MRTPDIVREQGDELQVYGEYLGIDEWRARTLAKVMWFAFPLAALTMIPYLYFALVRGPTPQGVVLLPSVVAVILATVIRRPFRLRALCLLIVPYWIGMTSIFMRGTFSLFFLLAFVIGVVILMGPRYAYGAIVLCAVTLMAGAQYATWQPSIAGIDTHGIVTWCVITFNFVSVATVIVVASGSLLSKVEFSLMAQKIAAHSVDLRQEEITRLKNEVRALKTGLSVK